MRVRAEPRCYSRAPTPDTTAHALPRCRVPPPSPQIWGTAVPGLGVFGLTRTGTVYGRRCNGTGGTAGKNGRIRSVGE